jgi:hypothetical protein
MADVHNAMVYPPRKRGEKNAFESPVGEIDQGFSSGSGMGKYVTKEIARKEKGFHFAIPAGKEMIRLFQNDRRAALRALVVNEKLRVF